MPPSTSLEIPGDRTRWLEDMEPPPSLRSNMRTSTVLPRLSFILVLSTTGLGAFCPPVLGQLEPEVRGEPRLPLSAPVVLEGFVLEPDGAPAEGAVVVSSAGGRAVADRNGSYRLEVCFPGEAESI